eukprot:11290954-Alexandrium_andersonii.AAC.1
MSASLVGSEMCIRDSQKPLTPPSLPVPHGALSGATGAGGPRQRVSECMICLLYTSDAADDM